MKSVGSCFFNALFPQRSALSSERGVEAVELAIVFPLFICVVFGFIDTARMISGYSSVRSAAALGARFAVGEQRREWTAVEVAMGGPEVQSVVVGNVTLQIVPEFCSEKDLSPWYPNRAVDQFILDRKLFRMEIRAIGYANQIMLQSVGEASYPCEEPGCFYCFTLRGDQAGYNKYFSVQVGGAERRWTSKTLAMQCTYFVPITSTLVGFGWLPRAIPVTGRAYIPINDYAGIAYDPASGS